jgi:D-xylonolactonase
MTERIAIWGDTRAILGEGIIWDDRRKKLFWIDIKQAKLFESDPTTPSVCEWKVIGDVGGSIGSIAADRTGSGFIAATGRGFVRLVCNDQAKTAKVEFLANPEADKIGNRFNDGAIDPFGHFWAGTMDDAERQTAGSWWRWDGLRAEKMASGFKVSNGPAFISLGQGHFQVFMTDSAKRKIYTSRYSAGIGLSELRAWAEFDIAMGYPDGMCFDHKGRLWIAFWDGSAIRAFDPRCAQCDAPIAQVNLPVQRPTKLAFTPAGDCFVTSASVDIGKSDIDGALIRIDASHSVLR